jgi:L-ascorbate metabolism protein UlaG (beta-lactamase superfamily)
MTKSKFKITSYTSNPNLETLWPDWKGTPLDQNGDFMNHHQPMSIDFMDVLKWQSSANPDKDATYLIRLAGVLMIIDPLFGSPSLLMKRLSKLPIDIKKLTNLDLILLSHDHRDHADEASMRILAKQNPAVQYLTGLKVDELLKRWTGSKKIQSAGWFQRFETDFPIKISYLPSRHWGKRLLADDNKRLWGGFMIESETKTIYFAGDSGYGPHFKEIAKIFPKIDIAMIGIGAFKPEWFMGPSHTSPGDAYQAFKDIGAKTMLPMHYGTFDLADEPIGEPFRFISDIKNNTKDDIRILKVGEVLKF